MKAKKLIRIADATWLYDRVLEFLFTDGSSRQIDLAPYLHGPVFEEIAKDDKTFRQFRIDPELRTIVWPNGADIDPDTLVHGIPHDRLDERPSYLN